MDKQKREEYLSIAYLRTISASGGILFSLDHEDSDSVDVNLKFHWDDVDFDSTIGIQLKATSSKSCYREDEDFVYYDLKVKNYNDLRRNSSESKFLTLLILPEEENEWINQTIDELIIRRNMYWLSLYGSPETTNTSTIRIKIPKVNLVTKESLLQLLRSDLEED